MKELHTQEKEEILSIINKFKESQKTTNRKLKEKMALSKRDSEIGGLQMKAMVDEIVKDQAKKKLEEDIKALREKELDISEEEDDNSDQSGSMETATASVE